MAEIEILPLLQDNYAYAILAQGTNEVVLVDPSEARPILAYFERTKRKPKAILCTHHHHDHVGGVGELLAAYPGLPVYGSHYDASKKRIPHQSAALKDREHFEIIGLPITAMTTPGHTLGALCYHVDGQHLFTGDTLFLAGCGRLFEGDAAMMFVSLSRLAHLDASTLVYCGHEYTEKNLSFTLHVEPTNTAAEQRLERVRAMRGRLEPSVPALLSEERETNLFLRARDAASFGKLREARDAF